MSEGEAASRERCVGIFKKMYPSEQHQDKQDCGRSSIQTERNQCRGLCDGGEGRGEGRGEGPEGAGD